MQVATHAGEGSPIPLENTTRPPYSGVGLGGLVISPLSPSCFVQEDSTGQHRETGPNKPGQPIDQLNHGLSNGVLNLLAGEGLLAGQVFVMADDDGAGTWTNAELAVKEPEETQAN